MRRCETKGPKKRLEDGIAEDGIVFGALVMKESFCCCVPMKKKSEKSGGKDVYRSLTSFCNGCHTKQTSVRR